MPVLVLRQNGFYMGGVELSEMSERFNFVVLMYCSLVLVSLGALCVDMCMGCVMSNQEFTSFTVYMCFVFLGSVMLSTGGVMFAHSLRFFQPMKGKMVFNECKAAQCTYAAQCNETVSVSAC